MEDVPIIKIEHVSKVFDGKEVLKDVSLDIKRGEFVTILGPSGCGKTTLLSMIAGFEKPHKVRYSSTEGMLPTSLHTSGHSTRCSSDMLCFLTSMSMRMWLSAFKSSMSRCRRWTSA